MTSQFASGTRRDDAILEDGVVGRRVVWDLPIRVFHWSLVLLMAGSWWTATYRHLEWHRYCGYAILWLVMMRIYWGVAGSSTARFASFVRGPAEIIQYLRGESVQAVEKHGGHNPLGALSVVALILVVLGQLSLGLFAVDVDGLESGPLSYLVSFKLGRLAAKLHHISFNVLLTLITLHLAAVVFYVLVKRRQLVGPMITGRRSVTDADAADMVAAPLWRLLVAMPVAAVLVWAISIGFGF
jgi:cytochrome b